MDISTYIYYCSRPKVNCILLFSSINTSRFPSSIFEEKNKFPWLNTSIRKSHCSSVAGLDRDTAFGMDTHTCIEWSSIRLGKCTVIVECNLTYICNLSSPTIQEVYRIHRISISMFQDQSVQAQCNSQQTTKGRHSCIRWCSKHREEHSQSGSCSCRSRC